MSPQKKPATNKVLKKVEGRYAEWSDFIADSAGAVCGMMLFTFGFRLKKQPTS